MSFDFSYPGTFPSAKGWGPGWPNCNRSQVTALVVDGVEFVGGIRIEVRELAERLIRESVKRGYVKDLMSPGCWGGACRSTKRSDGSSTGRPSVHSWYLAVDVNAPRNVFGADEDRVEIRDTPAFDMEEFWQSYGWRWLGDDIKDWMHFDFAGSPADARRMLAKARNNRIGEVEDEMAVLTNEEQKQLRNFLNELSEQLHTATARETARRIASSVVSTEKDRPAPDDAITLAEANERYAVKDHPHADPTDGYSKPESDERFARKDHPHEAATTVN